MTDDEEVEKRWQESDAPYKAKCESGHCISFYHPIDCVTCKKDSE
jgi:hypothetical protein